MYTEPNGTFWAYYAHRHRHLKECNYYIRAPLGYAITLHFRYIHLLTPYKECNTHTYLEVFTGVQSNSTSLGRFCGSYAPAPVYSTSNSLLVKFVRPRFSSDKDGPYFLAKYTTQKGRHNSCWWTEHLTSCQLGLEACDYLTKCRRESVKGRQNLKGLASRNRQRNVRAQASQNSHLLDQNGGW